MSEIDERLGITPKKTNRTPDLTDEQYMEQMHLIAQTVSVMPAQRDGMPNVSTPPPIRARWAAYLLTLGLRIHPELATHKLKAVGPASAGRHGPREMVALGGRTSLSRDDLWKLFEKHNPEMYAKVMSGEVGAEQLFAGMTGEMQEAVRLAEQLKAQEEPAQTDDAS